MSLGDEEKGEAAHGPQGRRVSIGGRSVGGDDAVEQLTARPTEQERTMGDAEVAQVCLKLREAVALREKYRQPAEREPPGAKEPVPMQPTGQPRGWPFVAPQWFGERYVFEMQHGLTHVWRSEEEAGNGKAASASPPLSFAMPPTIEEFTADLARLRQHTLDQAVNSFCYRRLQKLEAGFTMYCMEHAPAESAEQKAVPHRDFYNTRKVDTHVSLDTAMNQKHLLRFIKKKMKLFPNEIVLTDRGRKLTLSQVFEEKGISPYDLNLDSLGMNADASSFCNLDKFNLKYNPMGKSQIGTVFLRTENELQGRYFAEIARELFDNLEESKYQNTEYRISIFGIFREEWDRLAAWVVDHQLYSQNNRWLVQLPRLYGMYARKGKLESFQDFLQNVFAPLFEVSVDPASHPKLHLMLQQVVGFDCVGDESKAEGPLPTPQSPAPHPDEWGTGDPHYAYYCYYIYANLYVLNQLRAKQGLHTFDFRPHAGEAGELNHLHATFLTARGINHGISLRKSPSLQYLYYLAQVGLALSPISNNSLFLQLSKNPFDEFFAVGLNVSLSTGDPLMFHHTKEPLMEEYCVAKQVWRLSSVDVAEIARNSVLQSSFDPCSKAHWLGASYRLPGVAGNDITKTNLPNMRVQYRHATLSQELAFIGACAAALHAVQPDSPLSKRGSLLDSPLLRRLHSQQAATAEAATAGALCSTADALPPAGARSRAVPADAPAALPPPLECGAAAAASAAASASAANGRALPPPQSDDAAPGERRGAPPRSAGGARRSSSLLHARLQEQHALVLEAQEQTRRANAAYAKVRRTHQLRLALQVAAPVLCALAAGLALGGLLSGRAVAADRLARAARHR